MTPFKAMYGYEPLIPLEIDMNNFKGKTQVSLEMLAKMQEDLRECRKNIERAQAWAKLYSNQHRKPRSFEVGDMVYLRVKPYSSLSTWKCTKLSPRYCGPFKILEKINEVTYRLDLTKHKNTSCIPCEFFEKGLV